MHLPDGILPFNQTVIYWLISLIFIFYYFIKSKKIEENNKKRLVYIALFSAIITICTSISVPTPFGIAIHFLLISFTVIILGPYTGVIVTFIALLLQSLFMGMGGILSLGANVIVMGVIISFSTFYSYNIISYFNESIAIFLSTFIGILFASIIQLLIILFSGTGDFRLLLLTLIPFYILVGVIEGVGTTFIINFIKSVQPDIFDIVKI